MQTDASASGLGVVLTQNQEGEERVIAFASRTLSAAERNYSVTERECLVVVWGIRKFREYLEGFHFKVITDHSSLRWLSNLRNPTGRLARWGLELQGYDIEIIHRKGALHHVPDALSRMSEGDEVPEASVDDTQDSWYLRRIQAVEERPKTFPNWKVENGMLYRQKPNTITDDIVPDLEAWNLVLPKELRQRVIEESHTAPQAGHLGIGHFILCLINLSYQNYHFLY